MSSSQLKRKLVQRHAKLQELTHSPSLLTFLRDDDGSLVLWDWFREESDQNSFNKLSFFVATEEAAKISDKSIFDARAEVIIEMYFGKGDEAEIKEADKTNNKSSIITFSIEEGAAEHISILHKYLSEFCMEGESRFPRTVFNSIIDVVSPYLIVKFQMFKFSERFALIKQEIEELNHILSADKKVEV
jgi:hypothetical protein